MAEQEFVPLRKSLTRKSSGKEDNFVLPYATVANEITEEEVHGMSF